MEHGACLQDHQLGRNHRVSTEPREADGRVTRRDSYRGVDDEHGQWSRRERCSAATQFGAGEPSSPTFHTSGSSAIGYSSSSTVRRSWSLMAWRLPTRRSRSRPERIQRRNLAQLADVAGHGEVSIECLPARDCLGAFGLDLLFDLAYVVIELGGHHRPLNWPSGTLGANVLGFR